MGKSPLAITKPKSTNITSELGASSASSSYPQDEPPDVSQIGISGWTILHLMAAKYPEKPSDKDQTDMHQFLLLWSKFYPCWWCAKDLKSYMVTNEPELVTRDAFGRWLCGLHNKVNVKLGKPEFNCDLWKRRWKDGWDEADSESK